MALPTLTPTLLSSRLQGREELEVPTTDMLSFPERAVQFGTGAFLRGFVGYFVDEANQRGAFRGRVVAIGSTGSGREQALNDQGGLYTLIVRGVQRGQPVQEERVIAAMSRAISAANDWPAVLVCARNPDLALIFSNTTEVGIALDESDVFDAVPPRSYPGKLTRFLYERASAFAFASDKGVVVLPCELLEANGDRLRDIVVALSHRWDLGTRFLDWLEKSVLFCNTLVDRIVPGAPGNEEAARIEQSLGYRDGLLTACEPYRLFAIEGGDALRARLGFAGSDGGIVVVPDITPFRERKVRVLNGAHTVMVPAALLAGCETVRDAMEHEAIGAFVRRVMLDEIVPGLDAEGAAEFARDVLDRFANPHIRHELFDITLQGTTKMRVRVVPSITAYARRLGRVPTALSFGFAAWLRFMRGDLHERRRAEGRRVPEDPSGDVVRELWRDAGNDRTRLVRTVCANVALWNADLSAVPGFVDAVREQLDMIEHLGVVAAAERMLAAGSPA